MPRQRRDRTVVVQPGQSGEPLGRDVRGVRGGDERVGVRRVTHHEDPHVAGRSGIECLPGGGEDLRIGTEQVGAFHAHAAGLGADEQNHRGAVERLDRIVIDLGAGQQREGAVVELHHHALGRPDGLRHFEQPQRDRRVAPEHRTGRDAEQGGVSDLARRAGDDDGHRRGARRMCHGTDPKVLPGARRRSSSRTPRRRT